ncbi:hypothetical protein B9J90_15295 [Vibrio sp. V09_P4A23P171]|uniref:hypothetical protein n=1 Tax=unclassified Vibrio TaxID=2614977 RepID=UPI000B8EB8F6|nr:MULTISPECIES: hypothetical protein [unclassified Vibrio]NAX18623.1 hypothetical protein [Vibrio sp. V22_P2S10T140]OXX33257.1 hypothetical protein B9J90_15295 [Vibrio sp. V09_P4A23P171]OXX38095.1 hypothetical protein B9J83_16255 [Vibrio sp. V07_P2A8T137]OXX62610.1 hypothetical protein B9J82_04980 [Vibrio sp. V10_P2A27P122]OXX67433.1 hypothetical protein B9J87_16825 [Vibrio sp. V19_P1S1T109]
MNKSSLLIATALVFSTSSAFAGGTLGGNPSADSGAVNVNVGKCTQYKLDVKAAKESGKDVSTIAVPKGCEAIKEK